MRGNPFVNLVAILVMLISVLVAGKVWIDWKVSKGEPVRKEVIAPQKPQYDKDKSKFETAVKETKE